MAEGGLQEREVGRLRFLCRQGIFLRPTEDPTGVWFLPRTGKGTAACAFGRRQLQVLVPEASGLCGAPLPQVAEVPWTAGLARCWLQMRAPSNTKPRAKPMTGPRNGCFWARVRSHTERVDYAEPLLEGVGLPEGAVRALSGPWSVLGVPHGFAARVP